MRSCENNSKYLLTLFFSRHTLALRRTNKLLQWVRVRSGKMEKFLSMETIDTIFHTLEALRAWTQVTT